MIIILFLNHQILIKEIDGKALLLLTTEILMKYMGFKLGPALKLNNYLEKLRQPIQQDTLAKPEAATYY